MTKILKSLINCASFTTKLKKILVFKTSAFKKFRGSVNLPQYKKQWQKHKQKHNRKVAN